MRVYLLIVVAALQLYAQPTLSQENPENGLEETETQYLAAGPVDTKVLNRQTFPPGRFYFREKIDISVFNQFKVPACVGFSIASAVEIKLNWECAKRCHCRQKLEPFSAFYIFNQIYREGSKGAPLGAGLDTLQSQGICPKKIFENVNIPDPTRKKPNKTDRDAAEKFRLWQKKERIFFLPSEKPDPRERNDLKISFLRYYISSGTPIIVGLRCPVDFFSFRGERYALGNGELPEKPNHAAVVTGYDDHKKEVEILGSYGQGWGYNGFVSIGYEDFYKMALFGYVTHLEGDLYTICSN